MKRQATTLGRIAIPAAFVLIGWFSQSSSAVFAASTAGSANWSSTVAKPVTDPALNRTAFMVHIPAGWKFTGMLERIGGCHGTSVPSDGLAYTALAPDGVTAIEKLPGTSWSWVSDGTSVGGPKCPPVKIDTAAEFLLNIAIPNLRPDARDITVVPPTPQFKQALEEAQQRMASQNGQMGKRTIDAARVRLQYTLHGHPVEELLFAAISCQELDMPAYPVLHRPAVQKHICSSSGVTIRRAPQGKLDALISRQLPPPEIDRQWDQEVVQNMRSQFAAWQKRNDEEFRAIQNHYKEMTNGIIQRGQEFQDAQRSSFENAMAQDRATQGAIDHAAQMQVRDSLNRQDFIDPNTGRKIETSNEYTHSWIGSDGQSVVLTDDSNFDPNGLIDPVRQSWTELIPVN